MDYVDGYIFDTPMLLVSEDGENLRSRKTPIAFLARGKYWVNNHAHVLAAAPGFDLRFLYYAVSTYDVNGHGLVTGSGQPKLNAANLKQVSIPALPFDEQRRIAGVLGAFDDLIEANRSIIASLIRIAVLHYQRVSDGTETIHLGDVFEAGVSGVWGDGVPSTKGTERRSVLRGKDLEMAATGITPSPPTRYLSKKQVDSRVPSVGEVWTAGSGTLGPSYPLHPRFREAFEEDISYSNFVKRLVPREGDATWYGVAWMALMDLWRTGGIDRFKTGTAMPNLDVHALLRDLPVPSLSPCERAKLNETVDLALAPDLGTEIKMLTRQRDELLPLLMSGSVRVRDQEAVARP